MSLSLMRARLVLPLAAAFALFALALCLALFPEVNAASTPGSINITPSSGPVGTSVQVDVIPPADATGPVMYTLGTTTSDPASGGCSTQKPIPGVAPFTVGTQGGGTNFDWPASLTQGPYWLCASPTSGGGTVYSSQPYTVTTADVPTATATPMQRTTADSVVAKVPAGGVPLGSTFTLTIRHWVSPRGTPPEAVNLTSIDPSQQTSSGDSSGYAKNAHFTTASGSGAGDYVLTVTVPDTLIPLTYWAEVSDQGGRVYSGPFNVIARATPPPFTSPGPSSTDGPLPFPIIFVPIVTVLVCIAVLMLTGALLRRRARSYR
ncbi:MAG: hypothetical protein ACXVDA_01955 [Ktedonobacterales bacterium]